jgi:hypothetical protein
MNLEIFDCEQGSPEWHQCRLGVVTSSEFHSVMAKDKGGGESKTRATYMRKLIGEIITGEVSEGYSNAHMERGKIMEAEARDYYAFMADVEPKRIGFLKRGRVGCSPDSFIGDDGLHEIKTKLPHLHIDVLLADELPPEHKAQCQGSLWVSGREWIDFQSYWPKLPAFIKRVYRDEVYIKSLSVAVDSFIAEMDELHDKITRRHEPRHEENLNVAEVK